MANAPSFELVIPCFNEADSLRSLIETTVRAASNMGLTPRSFQLVLVDNGSQDGTSIVLKELQEKDWGYWFRVVQLKENQGYGGGIFEGLKATQAPWVGFTHADLQCDPKDALQAFLDGRGFHSLAIVRGTRRSRKKWDWLVSRIYELFVGLLWGFWDYDLNAQPKVFSRELIKKIQNPPKGIPFDAFILWVAKKNGFFTKKIEVTLKPRAHAYSHWNHGLKRKAATYFKVLKELWKVRVTVQSQQNFFESLEVRSS